MEKSVTRNYTLDTVKGILILLVILGHIVNGQGVLHYYIYLFHIPLFLGVSGYLLKKELFDISFLELGKKYFYRLVIPFLFIYLVYSLIEQELFSLIYPWYHLWFIPAFLLFVLYLFIIEKLNLKISLILLISFIFSVFWTGNYGYSNNMDVLYYLGDKRFYFDFIFLFFGYYIRNYFEKRYIPWGLPLLVFSLSAIYLFIFHKAYMITFIYSLNWVGFNLAFIYITLRISRSFPLIQVPYINKIGQTSLPIYLWHILPLLFLRSIMDKYGMNIYLYLGLYFLSVTVVIAFIFRFKTSSFMKVMLMGELNKKYIKE